MVPHCPALLSPCSVTRCYCLLGANKWRWWWWWWRWWWWWWSWMDSCVLCAVTVCSRQPSSIVNSVVNSADDHNGTDDDDDSYALTGWRVKSWLNFSSAMQGVPVSSAAFMSSVAKVGQNWVSGPNSCSPNLLSSCRDFGLWLPELCSKVLNSETVSATNLA